MGVRVVAMVVTWFCPLIIRKLFRLVDIESKGGTWVTLRTLKYLVGTNKLTCQAWS